MLPSIRSTFLPPSCRCFHPHSPTMRLLPPPFEGLHPAFPAPDNSSLPAPSGHESAISATKAGLVGLLPLTLGAVLRLPRLRAFAFEASAYGLIGFAASGVLARQKTTDHVRSFLATQGIEIPAQKVIDRLGRFDFDDGLILGAATGIFIASLPRRPWSVSYTHLTLPTKRIV